MREPGVTRTGRHDGAPGSVLFVCSMNAVRSVMAAAILRHLAGPVVRVDSAGLRAGVPDPLVSDVMDEIGIGVFGHRPKSLEDVRGDAFDLIVTLAPEAHHRTLEFAHDMAVDVEFWPTMDATVGGGGRDSDGDGDGEDERLLRGYRQVRDQLFARIKARFHLSGGPTV